MNITCNDRERIFLDGSPEEWAALESHAAACPSCRQEVEGWKNLSVAARDLHQEWDSSSLWPRIERALAQQPSPSDFWWSRFLSSWNFTSLQWQTAAAALLLVVLTACALWFVKTGKPSRDNSIAHDILLKERAVDEAERAQAAYEQAINKLDGQARAQLENASTPLMANYREKLEVLDSAIAELKTQEGINPANGHLRRQLLAMYQEKQDTLEQVLETKQ